MIARVRHSTSWFCVIAPHEGEGGCDTLHFLHFTRTDTAANGRG